MSTQSAHSMDLTALLADWRLGNDQALEDALPVLYGHLKSLAGKHLAAERSHHTLETRDLVHEAFMRLNGQRSVPWQSRRHFLAIAGRMMRRILVDHARRKRCRITVCSQTLDGAEQIPNPSRGNDLQALDDAMQELAQVDADLAQIVELRFFAGLKHQEVASLLEISEPTVRRRFRTAKAWLFRRLHPAESTP